MMSKQVLESIHGQMVAFMRDIGTKVNNMALELIKTHENQSSNTAFGNMERESSGLVKKSQSKSTMENSIMKLNTIKQKAKVLYHQMLPF